MSKKWYVECLESPIVVYYLLLDAHGTPIARFVDERTAENIAKIHNEDITSNYPEAVDAPEYPPQKRVEKLAHIQGLEKPVGGAKATTPFMASRGWTDPNRSWKTAISEELHAIAEELRFIRGTMQTKERDE